MKRNVLVSLLLAAFFTWSAFAADSPALTFMRAIESGHEIVFSDNAKAGAGGDNFTSCDLHFSKDAKLTMNGYAYDIRGYTGTYVIQPNCEVTVSLEAKEPKWPVLLLSIEAGEFVLKRKDGLRSFREYWNLYPEAVEQVFPLRAKIPQPTKPK